MNKSLAFYRDLLGMKIIREPHIDDDRIGLIIGEQAAKCKIVHLISGNAFIELFQYLKPKV